MWKLRAGDNGIAQTNHRRHVSWGTTLLSGAVVAGLAAGCASTTKPAGTPTTTTATSSSTVATSPAPTSNTPSTSTTQPSLSTMSFAVYFLRGSYLGVARRTVPATAAVGVAALDALLRGPNSSEQAAGLSSAAPAGSRLLGLSVSSGMAKVDFDSAYAMAGSPSSELQRVAQVVFTLTQFPSVNRVSFEINGATPQEFGNGTVDLRRPLGRSDVLGALPAILVESPAVGDSLHGALQLRGMANVYEAQFRVQLIDGTGRVLVDHPVRASAGSGTWGTFDATFAFTASAKTVSTLRVYDVSMKDGSPIDEIDLHLTVGP